MNAIRKRPIRILHIAALTFAFANAARADIFQWEYINPADPSQGKQQSTTLAPDGAGVDAVPGAYLSSRNLTMAYLIGANLTNAAAFQTNLINADLSEANLTNAGFRGATVAGAHLRHADLTYAFFGGATLTDADFTNAKVRGANFATGARCGYNFACIGTGITLAQLYSTASYQAHDLSGVGLAGSDLAGGMFAGQILTPASFHTATLTGADFTGAVLVNADFSYAMAPGADFTEANLTNANFYVATLTDADFTAADARGAFYLGIPASAVTTNLINPDGQINGLDLDAGELLVVRDYDGDSRYDPARPLIPITVDQHLAMGPGATLRMVFEADAWDSNVSFAPGIPVTLGGTLELTFADDVNLASQLGRTLDLFDWTGVTPTSAFAVSSPYAWDLSELYTTGQVTLTAVPEPASFAPIAAGVFVLTYYRRRKIS
jgi:uncharacterized protein YjbI with pentapeptide repeats